MAFLNANHVSKFSSDLLCSTLPKVLYEDDSMFSAEFNMTTKDGPGYEAVAVVFDKEKKIEELHLNFISNLNITLSLKTLYNEKMETYKEIPISSNCFIDIYNIKKPLKEFVIFCPKSKNSGKTGVVTVKSFRHKV